MLYTATPIVPKDPGGPLRVIALGRVSTDHQDEENIPASQRYAERTLRQAYAGEIDLTCLGEQASGLLADRPSIREARRLIETGTIDLVIAEDVSRIYRSSRHLLEFIEDAIDRGTRVICFADRLDTADERWKATLHVAMLHHEMDIPATRRRVKRTADQTFDRGGMVMKVRFGYRKLTKEEAASGRFGTPGLGLAKLPEYAWVFAELRERALRRDSPSRMAAWLRGEGVPVGPYVTGGWTGRLVEELLRDPILSGRRTFRKTVQTRVLRTGKPNRRPNEQPPERKDWPELAFMTPAEQDEMVAAMGAGRPPGKGNAFGRDHPRYAVPRSRTLWPGQHARCGACGGLMYRFGKHLKCSNAVPHGPQTCWNHAQAVIEVIHAKVLPWVVGVLDRHPRFREWLAGEAWAEYRRQARARSGSTEQAVKLVASLRKQQANVLKAVRQGDRLASLLDELRAVESELAAAEAELERLRDGADAAGSFASPGEVSERLGELVVRLAETSFEFADLVRRLVPRFVIRPVQALDCPQVRCRAELTLRLGPGEGGGAAVEESAVIDLFEPPAHVLHLAACVAARRDHPDWGLREIGGHLGIGYMTVKRAFHYHRLMQQAGTTDPYRAVVEEPERASRWVCQDRRKTK